MKEYTWAILGCGDIANQAALAMQKMNRPFYGVWNRTREKAVEFASKYGINKVYDNSEELFLDEQVDIVYIATPHNTHIAFIEAALNHGKHVLCEKAITLNSDELDRAVLLAERKKLILAEAMTIYHMPLYRWLGEIAKEKKLGRVCFVQMNFGSFKEYDPGNRFFNPDLAGGALLDIGVYALSFVRWFFSEAPDQITSQVRFAPSGVDEQAGILLMNGKQEMASVSMTLHAKQPKRGTVAFENGYIEIFDYPRADEAVITWTTDGHKEKIQKGKSEDALRYEIEDIEKAVTGEDHCVYLDYTRDVMKIMTKLRRDWNLVYPEEVKK